MTDSSVNRDVPCIILAGGLGTRLKSAVPDKPKCLAPIGDSNFLALLISHLRTFGVRRFYLSLGYLAHLVKDEIKKFPKPELIKYAIEHTPLGTGGGVLHTCSLFTEDDFLLINGDTWIDGSLEHLFAPLEGESNELARITGVHRDDCTRYGAIQSEGRLVTSINKGCPRAGYIDGGYYRISKKIFEGRKDGDNFSLDQDVFKTLMRRNQLTIDKVTCTFTDIGVPESYEHFIRLQAGS